jgi:hypothetical protein
MSTIRFNPFTGRGRYIDDHGWENPTDADRRHAGLLLKHFGCDLSARDRHFLFGASRQRSPLSLKQLKWLRDIEAKLRSNFNNSTVRRMQSR